MHIPHKNTLLTFTKSNRTLEIEKKRPLKDYLHAQVRIGSKGRSLKNIQYKLELNNQ